MADEQLQSMLAGLADSYKPNLVERLWPLALSALATYLIIHSRKNA